MRPKISRRTFARADSSPRCFAFVQLHSTFPQMASQWFFVGPEALYGGPRHVAKIWNVREIYITESGCSSADVPAADKRVHDTDRVMYLRNYLTQLQRATSEGVHVRGYFLWSLMDNFEWATATPTASGCTTWTTRRRRGHRR